VNPISTARQLRRDQTDAERDLWRALRSHRFAGFKFRRQHPVGDYILDFYCAAARLDIWDALQRRTGCVQVMKNVAGQRFVPPDEKSIKRIIK